MSSTMVHNVPSVKPTAEWSNDLTYSDDEDSIWDLLEQNYSSPEGQEPPLIDSFPPQDQLFHPLARESSYVSGISDEGSYLAYSVSSVPGEEEPTTYSSYGSVMEDPFKKPNFRHAPSLVDRKKHNLPAQQYLLGKEDRDAIPSIECHISSNNQRRLLSPLPTHHEESPLTAATATDVTISPIEEQQRESVQNINKQKRLKKIRKAAKAREAEVQRVRGVEQPLVWNDGVYGAIFLLQFTMVTIGALVFGPEALSDDMSGKSFDNGDYNPFEGLESDDIIITASPAAESGIEDLREEQVENYVNVVQLVSIACGYASLCSLLALGFMTMLSKNILHVMLMFAISASMICTVVGVVMSRGLVIPAAGGVALVCSLIYSVITWHRIPFAATNLNVALRGMRSMLDIPLLGFGALSVSFLWTIWCICSFVGVFDFLTESEQISDDWLIVVTICYLLSYYWTIQVIKGITQATVASIVGKWWNQENSLSLCSSSMRSSLKRNLMQSFGSICIGSLILDPCVFYHRVCNFLQLVKSKISSKPTKTSQKDHSNPVMNSSCTSEDNVVCRNINRWSYTYIGLYGYKFSESGWKASELFQARGWAHVVADDLILTLLTISSLVTGASTACMGLIVEEVDGFSFTTLHKPVVTAFLVGLSVGFIISSVFMSIIEGSVNAILVCYATSPVSFHANHTSLSRELKSAWKEILASRD